MSKPTEDPDPWCTSPDPAPGPPEPKDPENPQGDDVVHADYIPDRWNG